MDSAPTAVPTAIPQYSQNPEDQFDAEAYKLIQGMNPVLLGHAEKLADSANNKIRENDLIQSAAQGIKPLDRVRELAKSKAQMELERSQMQMQETDPTAMNNAFENVTGIMGNAPIAPQMQRPRLSESEQLGSLLAGALGGGWEGAAQAQNAAFQGAGIRANRENQIAQANFEAENSQWLNKLRTAQQVANNQTNLYNQSENRNQRQFGNELRLVDGRIAKTQQDIEDVQKQVDGYVKDTQKAVFDYIKLRQEFTDADAEFLAKDIAERERRQGLPPGYIMEQITMVPVGYKSPGLVNQQTDNQLNQDKFNQLKTTQSWKNAKALFDARLKTVNMMGQVTEADRQALLPLAQELFPDSPESLLPQVGEDWRKLQGQQRLTETNRANTAREGIATDREARLGSGGGSGGGGGKGTKTDKQYRIEYEKLGNDIIGLQAEMDVETDPDEIKKIARKITNLTAQQTNISTLIEWTDEEIAQTQPAQDAISGALGQFGMVSPLDPKASAPPVVSGANPNPPNLKGAIGGKQPQKTNTGGKGGGGNNNPRPDTKPVKSAPDAKKPPSANMTKFGKYELKPNK